MAALVSTTTASKRSHPAATRTRQAHVLPTTRRPFLSHSGRRAPVSGWHAKGMGAQTGSAMALVPTRMQSTADRRLPQLRGSPWGMSARPATAVARCF